MASEEIIVEANVAPAVAAMREYAASIVAGDAALIALERRIRTLATRLENSETPARQLASAIKEIGVTHNLPGLASELKQIGEASNLGTSAVQRETAAIRQLAQQQSNLNRVVAQGRRAAAAGAPGYGPGAAAGAGGAGGGGGFIASARAGFNPGGGGISGLGFTVGQAAKFGIIYGSMYRILEGTQKALKDSFEQAVHYQRSVAELQFQTGQSASAAGKLASQLQAAATQYGESGSVGIEAGQKALGLYGATQAPKSIQDATAITAARVVTQLAFVTGKPVDELVEGLGALTKAFGQGAESIGTAADIVVRFGQIYHINAADLAAAAPKLAPLAESLGFSQKEAIALAASTAARTGLTPTAAVSGIDTLLAKGISGPLIAEMRKLGISGNQSIREQFYGNGGLADIFNDPKTTSAIKNEIIGAAGRGGTNRDIAIAQLESGKQALETANTTDASGALDDFTKNIKATLGGSIRELSGNLKQLSTDLSQSGLFDIIGVMIKGFDLFVQSLDGLLKIINTIPKPLRDLGFAAAFSALALKTTIPQRLGGFITGGRAGAARGAAGIPLGTRLGGIGATGLAATGLGAAALVLGGVAVSQAHFETAMTAARSALIVGTQANLKTADGFDGLTESLRNAANEVDSAMGPEGDVAKLGQIMHDVGLTLLHGAEAGGKNLLNSAKNGFGLFGGDNGPSTGIDTSQQELSGALKSLADAADIQAKAARKKIVQQGINEYGDFTAAQFSQGVETDTSGGYSFSALIGKLNGALDNQGRSTSAAQAASFNLNQFAGNITASIGPAFAAALDKVDIGQKVSTNKQRDSATIAAANIVPLIPGVLRGLGVTGIPTGLQNAQAAQQIAVILSQQGLDPETLAKITAALPGLITKAAQDATPVTAVLGASTDDALANMQKLLTQQSGAQYAAGDTSSKLKADKGNLDLLGKIFNGTANGEDQSKYTQSLIILSQQRAAYGKELADQAKILQGASQKNDSTLSKSIADGQSNIAKLISIATKTGDTDSIVALVAAGGDATYKLVLKSIDTAHKVAIQAILNEAKLEGIPANDPKVLAALESENNNYSGEKQAATVGRSQQASAAQFAAARAAANARPGDTVAQAGVSLQKAEADLTDAAKQGKDSIAYLNALTAVNSAAQNSADAILGAAQQVNTTAAARSGSPLASASANLKNAKLAMQNDKGNIEKFNQDLAAFFDAARAVAQAAAEAAHNRRELNIDSTNPVQQATEDAKTAKDLLKRQTKLFQQADSEGGSSITKNERDALNPLTKASQQANSNKLLAKINEATSVDSTKYDLGQESFSQHLAFEKSQKKYIDGILSGMKKTDEGYHALKEASDALAKNIKSDTDSMASQFNLGSIELPTAYSARRYAQGFGATGPSGATQTVTVTIYANSSQDIHDALSSALGGGNGYSNVVYG